LQIEEVSVSEDIKDISSLDVCVSNGAGTTTKKGDNYDRKEIEFHMKSDAIPV
jgi:hypothetical protein